MTKKLAELPGSVSVLSASVLLVLAILISPSHFPSLHVKKENRVPATTQVMKPASADKGASKTAPIPDQSDLSAELNEIYGDAAGSKSNSYFGVSENTAQKNKELASSVVADNKNSNGFRVTVPVSAEEYNLLLYCVGHETRSGSLKHKILIAEVIFNRVQGPNFGSTVKEVITAPRQFSVMDDYDGWGSWKPDPTTVEAVNLVISGAAPDYAKGAIYFCNPTIVGEDNWFDRALQVVCELEGHRFYK